MKVKRMAIPVLFAAGVVTASCWFAMEHHTSAKRLNPKSHRAKVGLGFHGQRNDFVGFVLRGPVVPAPQNKQQ